MTQSTKPDRDLRKNQLFDARPIVIDMGATLSECRRYRWSLWRRWDADRPACVFIGLNPSTADEREDDPTIRRCIGFAHAWGYGGLIMLNAYGFRATQPRDMKAAIDPIGYENNMAIELTAQATVDAGGIVIAAWGCNCDKSRAADVCRRIKRTIYCLGVTKDGHPKHPLYLRADTKPQVFWMHAG